MITLGPTEKNVYPVVPVREGIVFPGTENVLIFGRAKSIGAINEALKGDKKFLLLMQKNQSIEDPKKNDLYHTGVIVTVEKTVVGEKGEMNALVKGIQKVKVVEFTKETPYLEAKIQKIIDNEKENDEIQAMVKDCLMK